MARSNFIRVVRPTVGLVAFVVMAGSLLSGDLSDWGKQLPAKKRFVVLSDFNDEAVLDKETQLVWERFPGDYNRDGVLTVEDARSFPAAAGFCADKNVGGRKGWRLPAVTELASLVDPDRRFPALPDGHPFVFCIGPAIPIGGCKPPNPLNFWTNSIVDHAPLDRWIIDLNHGLVGDLGTGGVADFLGLVWCVRGPVAGPESH